MNAIPLKPPMHGQGLNVQMGLGTVVGPVVLWPMWTGSGDRADEIGGSRHIGAFHGPTWVPSKMGTVIGFDSTNDRIDVPNVMDMVATPLTIEAWVRRTDNDRGYVLFSNGGGGTTAVTFGINAIATGDIHFLVVGAAFVQLTCPGAILTINEWHHIAATWDGSVNSAGIVLYIDGSDAGRSFTGEGATLGAATGTWAIGGRTEDDLRNFGGQLAMVTFWDRVLPAEEIMSHVRDPWALIQPPSNLLTLAGATGAADIPWYYYAQQAAGAA